MKIIDGTIPLDGLKRMAIDGFGNIAAWPSTGLSSFSALRSRTPAT